MHKGMFYRLLGGAVFAGLSAGSVAAQSTKPEDVAYLQQFKLPNQTAFVLEAFDPATGAVTDRTVEPLRGPPVIKTATRRVYNGREIVSAGVTSCGTEIVRFMGKQQTCDEAARVHKEGVYRHSSVILCRVPARSPAGQPMTGTCRMLVDRNRSTPVVDDEDDGVVFLGFARLDKDASGKPIRSDLAHSQDLGEVRGLGANAKK